MKRSLSSFFVFVLAQVSFGQTKKDITGLYGKCPNGFLICEQIELKKDSTFEYGIFYDVGGWKNWTGTWKMKDDTLVLNSFMQPKDSIDFSRIDASYSFYQSGLIIDLKNILRHDRIYTWDVDQNRISNNRYLRKTNIKNKRFKIDNRNIRTPPMGYEK